jgi:small conductance mechanosensitive channel
VRSVRFQQVDEAERVAESARSIWETVVAALPRVGAAFVVAAVFVMLGKALRPLVHWWLSRRRTPSFAKVFARLAQAMTTILGVLLGITVVFPSVRPVDVLAGAGLLTVAAGFAFQDVLSNLLAGILLLFRQPFIGGDQVEVAGFAGTVQEINIRETVIRTFDGRKVVIPNSTVYSAPVEVRTGFDAIRTSLVVGVAYEADLRAARATALQAIEAVDGVLAAPAPEALYTELGRSTVNMEVRYWSEPTELERLRVADRAVEAVKAAMDEAGIEIPVDILALQATASFEAALRGVPVSPGYQVSSVDEASDG